MASRRTFINQLGMAAFGMSTVPWLGDMSERTVSHVKSRYRGNQKDGKLGIALVGLGSYASGQLAPALQQTEHCYQAGIVTGTPSKVPVWQEAYGIPDKNVYSYDTYDAIADNPDIDIIYIVLPNSMHAEYSIRAAEAGKHVICEKPMAITVSECDQMIAACEKAGKMLSIGYRLHFEPYNKEAMRLGQNMIYGPLTRMDSGFGFTLGDPNQWRVKKAMSGGGPLVDVGVYCVQAFCYTSGMEPLAVTASEGAKTNPQKFVEVEESLTWQFHMPGNIIAEGKASYVENMCYLNVQAAHGEFSLNPAFYYGGQSGTTTNGPMKFPAVNQQARQMDDFALAILNNRASPVPGEMGKRDVRYIQAIYEAVNSGRKVRLD